MKNADEEITLATSAISYLELFNINKIHQAVLEDKSLAEIAQIYLDTIEPLFAVKGSRLYTLDENNQLNLICENFDIKQFKVLEKKTGITVKSQVPVLDENNYLYQLMKGLEPIITSDPAEVKLIIQSHSTNPMIKRMANWSINFLGLKTFGVIPLLVGTKIIGLVTFSSTKKFSEEDKKSMIRYTANTSIGLIKKISSTLLLEQKRLSENVLNVLPIDVAIFDKNNRYKFVNEKAVKSERMRQWIIGKSTEEYGDHVGESEDFAIGTEQKLAMVEKTGQGMQWVEQLTDEESNQLHILRILQPIGVDGTEYKIAYGIDVSDLVNTQEKLKETQIIGRLGTWEYLLSTQRISFSEEISEILGISDIQNGIAIRDFYQLISQKYRDEFIQVLENRDSPRVVEGLEIEVKAKNQTYIYFSLNIAPIVDKNKVIHKIRGTMIDITERKNSEKKMKVMQDLLLTSQKIAKIGSWEVETTEEGDLKIVFLSDEFYRILGYEPNEIEINEDKLYQYVHPEDRGSLKSAIKKAIEEKSSYETVHRIIDKNGVEKYLHEKAFIHQLPESGKLRLVGTCQDITERIHAEQSIKKSEAQLSIAMKIARLGYWEFDVNERLFTFNDQFYAMLKTNVQNVGSYRLEPEKYAERFVYPDDQPLVSNEIGKALTTTDPTYHGRVEHRVVFGDGEIGWISVHFYIVKDSHGNTIKTYGVNQDITEQKRAEEKLKASKELLLTSEAMGKIGSWEVNFVDMEDWSKNLTTWSDEAYRIFGYEPGSVEVGFPFFLDHVHAEDKHLITDNFKNLFVPGSNHEAEFRIILKDGTLKHLFGKFYVKFSEDNVPLKMIGMTQDITTRKKLEQELENHNQKLKEEIEKQTRELTIANKNLDAFNYSISHDLKTPIRGLEIYVDLLKDSLNDQEALAHVNKLDEGITEVKEMISALLEFSKYSKSVLNKEKVNMNDKINHCISTYTKNSSCNVKFNVIQTPTINADYHLITHVIDNLVSNAIKYSSKKDNPVIEISGESDENFTTYYIKDNGDGFDENLNYKLFKPFSRLHNDSEFEGTGAGLAIVERIISRHNGTIWAESKKGAGATFYFKLPNK